ncbi:hypothetical protein, partial [Rhodovarius lipocyclicus]|uniref:hypothetical protein n=1 Tax=Rhodovarius lipocyclicus TaxID=268410 RepID=UPI001F28EC75
GREQLGEQPELGLGKFGTFDVPVHKSFHSISDLSDARASRDPCINLSGETFAGSEPSQN